jgi:hypothetical protein
MALRLGEALVREGLINNEQLAKALERQVVYGGRLGTNLIELGILTEESLVKFLGNVFGVPYADPKSFEGIKKEVIDTISASLAGKYMVVPIDLEPKRLHLAMLNPTDLRVIDEVRFVTGYEIVPYIASEHSAAGQIHFCYLRAARKDTGGNRRARIGYARNEGVGGGRRHGGHQLSPGGSEGSRGDCIYHTGSRVSRSEASSPLRGQVKCHRRVEDGGRSA